eukprot:jgi/Botrbrau1/9724/Bobra.0388s0017.1
MPGPSTVSKFVHSVVSEPYCQHTRQSPLNHVLNGDHAYEIGGSVDPAQAPFTFLKKGSHHGFVPCISAPQLKQARGTK